MDVSSMLSNGGTDDAGPADSRRQSHQYPTRHGSLGTDGQYTAKTYTATAQRSLRGNNGITTMHGSVRGSPAKKNQKHVVFQLIDLKDPRIQARLPMRVMISPHDTNESIVNTVKNFYGLYELGVSFEDKDGITIIADYKNFDNDMTVYVRTTVEQAPTPMADHARDSASPKKLALGAPFEMRPPSHSANHSPTRAGVRSLGARSMSPQSDIGRRSASVVPGGRPRTYRTKSKDNSVAGDAEGYSSGDNENGSVASSRRSKVDDIKADITVDNIVEGGRRKRAFESSELPLFVPPQVPMSASISSISPQRRSGPNYAASPYGYPNQQTFSYTQPLPSPQSYSNGTGSMQPPFPGNPYQNGFQPPSRQLRGSRMSGASYSSHRHSSGILPTPDPTIGSVISDEDVALQLMRLGDPTAFSHGRTSTSTVDDALSGKAEAASSDEGSDEEDEDDDDEDDSRPPVPRFSKEDVGPQRKKQRLMNELPSDGTSGEEYEDHRDGTFGNEDIKSENGQRKLSKPKSKVRSSIGSAASKPGKPRALSMSSKVKKTSMSSKMPMSPASLPSQSRKASISSSVNPHKDLGEDEDDLSSKPRCQRCRKSKKGCDRQRPCGRCKDAGIGADGCISEDEGNGRKGRYGRHMGVPIKKAEDDFADDSPPVQQASTPGNAYFIAPALPDKIKQNNNNKRKR